MKDIFTADLKKWEEWHKLGETYGTVKDPDDINITVNLAQDPYLDGDTVKAQGFDNHRREVEVIWETNGVEEPNGLDDMVDDWKTATEVKRV
ncbi:hypothetical protein [Lentibacillus salicampi]|uniref:Uncharacterized protein n=1 Tax=Lentibacillus salicampi TaxID=175306 RepID=A0A4Y9A7S1_9BACI|nr:hypothetical protein [Lentibacillus salicampi]TFJ91828.1 hypothetical protein E4U82_15755 [Lentibacillus salicampi]